MTLLEEQPVNAAPSRSEGRASFAQALGGIGLVTGLELKQRVRSTKWKWALLTAGLLIAGVTFLIVLAATVNGADNEGDLVFGLVVYFVLFLGLIISPTLSATSINGDSKEGTLAPLQATGLSSMQIVLGKLLASWVASLAFLAVSVPFMVFAYFNADANAWAMATVVLVLAAELLVVCALGMGWSAITARTSASAVLTYVSVAAITIVLPILFGLSAATFTEKVEVTDRQQIYYDKSSAPEGAKDDGFGNYYVCEDYTYTADMPRTDLTWWMLAVNPYVIVADSAPSPEPRSNSGYYYNVGVLDSVKQGVRELRLGPSASHNYCDSELTREDIDRNNRLEGLSPVWPWGLGIQALLGAGAVWIAVRRVRVPYGKLASGTRVA